MLCPWETWSAEWPVSASSWHLSPCPRYSWEPRGLFPSLYVPCGLSQLPLVGSPGAWVADQKGDFHPWHSLWALEWTWMPTPPTPSWTAFFSVDRNGRPGWSLSSLLYPGRDRGNPFLQKGKWRHSVISLGQSCLIEVSACAVLYGSHWI